MDARWPTRIGARQLFPRNLIEADHVEFLTYRGLWSILISRCDAASQFSLWGKASQPDRVFFESPAMQGVAGTVGRDT